MMKNTEMEGGTDEVQKFIDEIDRQNDLQMALERKGGGRKRRRQKTETYKKVD